MERCRGVGFGLIEMLIALVIVGVLSTLAVRMMAKPALSIDQETRKSLEAQNIRTDSYKGMIDSAKAQMQRVETESARHERMLDEYR
jgi:prepilin-type N-terminal cleavage/methylation domain-containing protein